MLFELDEDEALLERSDADCGHEFFAGYDETSEEVEIKINKLREGF